MYSEFVVGACPFCMSEKKIGLCSGNFTEVFKGRDRVGFYIAGVGDGYTDHYYPKFCPECGRRINWDKDEKMKEEVKRIAELRTLKAEERMAELDKKIKERIEHACEIAQLLGPDE